MKHIPATVQTDLPPVLATRLAEYRESRGFDPEAYLRDKVALINAYAETYGLTHAALGVSGGVDSALAAALLSRSALTPYLVFMPSGDTSGQDEARTRAQSVADTIGTTLHMVGVDPLVDATHHLVATMETLPDADRGTWARGQLAANTRALLLYYLCTTLNDTVENRAVVAGTTNLDEGGWLGYVGKTSDGLVDIQLISDLHKSEVYALAHHLDLPEDVRTAVPTGDMFDSRSDLDVMGATYDYVELLRPWLLDPEGFNASLDEESARAWAHGAGNLTGLHSYNAHKYAAASPAVHLDVMDTFIPGGWRTAAWTPATDLRNRVVPLPVLPQTETETQTVAADAVKAGA